MKNLAPVDEAADIPSRADLDDAKIEVYTFSAGGDLTVRTGKHRLHLEAACTLVSVRAAVGTAPVGAAVIVDVNLNGSTIYGTQSNRPTIAAGTNSDLGGATSVPSFAPGNYLTVDIDQVGSTTAGADLTVTVRVKRT